MAETRTRYLQTKPGMFVTPTEMTSTGLNSSVVVGTGAWSHVSFDNATRIVTVSPSVNDIRDYLVAGYLFRLSGSTPSDTTYYTIEAVLSSTTFRSVQTPPGSRTGGTVSFYYPSGAFLTGFDNTGRTILAAQTTVQGCLNTLDAQVNTNTGNISTLNTSISNVSTQAATFYNSDGQINNPKVWVGRVQNNSGTSTLTVNYASAGFTTVFSVEVSAERNTSTIGEVPLVSLRSFTTTSCVVQFVDSAAVILGGQGLEYTNSNSNFVHVRVTGI